MLIRQDRLTLLPGIQWSLATLDLVGHFFPCFGLSCHLGLVLSKVSGQWSLWAAVERVKPTYQLRRPLSSLSLVPGKDCQLDGSSQPRRKGLTFKGFALPPARSAPPILNVVG